jgi:hypothetical protein
MDAVQQFAEKLGVPVPKTFVIGGASKVNKLLNIRLKLIMLYFINSSVDGQVSNLYLFMLILLINNLAWTTAAVDNERVIAAVPIVMDILNLQKVNLFI